MSTRASSDLPSPPVAKSGWPWSCDVSPASPATEARREWPRISIVTPSFNQAQFIEETIRSVLLQGYPNLEYIIIDGGSTDGSVDIIRKYEPWLAYWVSEPDKGQAHAVNKGLRRITGDVWCYLNSDDLLMASTLWNVARTFLERPEAEWLAGNCVVGEAPFEGRLAVPNIPIEPWQCLVRGLILPQPSVFLRRSSILSVGYFDELLHYSFDHEYWCRLLLRGCSPLYLAATLSWYRLHPASKTMTSHEFCLEDALIAERWLNSVPAHNQTTVRRAIHHWRNHGERGKAFAAYATHGRWAALARLVEGTVRRPSLVFERATWGAVRRFVFVNSID